MIDTKGFRAPAICGAIASIFAPGFSATAQTVEPDPTTLPHVTLQQDFATDIEGFASSPASAPIAWASMTGTAVFKQMGGSSGYADYADSPDRVFTFTMYLEDHGDPGAGDVIWIEVFDEAGIRVPELSMAKPVLEAGNTPTMIGGNLTVH